MILVKDKHGVAYIYLERHNMKSEKVYKSDCINGEVVLDFNSRSQLVGIELLGGLQIMSAEEFKEYLAEQEKGHETED